MPKYARVLVDDSAGKAFDYELPEAVAASLQPGSRVRVPVRTRTALATVIELLDETDVPGVKLITAVVSAEPILSPLLLRLGAWMADYYCCSIEQAMKAVLPNVIRKAEVGHQTRLFARLAREVGEEEIETLKKKAPLQAAAVAFLAEAGKPVAVAELTEKCDATHAVIQALVKKGLVLTASATVERDPHQNETFLHAGKLDMNPEQLAVFARVTHAILSSPVSPVLPVVKKGTTGDTGSKGQEVEPRMHTDETRMEEKTDSASSSIRENPCSSVAKSTAEKTGSFEPQTDTDRTRTEDLPLSPVRENPCLSVAKSSPPKPILLHGVTGSGKTEIYLQAISLVLDRGQSAIMLVPEISLTPQTVERFKSRFAATQHEVAVLHSHLSEGERHDEWHKIRTGRARIVIGARSAIFAPCANLGLIVVDEEHENTYKQEETPRYHGRDIAVLRARMEGCAIVLGSATPSLESFHNAQLGKYELLRLTQRVDDKKMPFIRIMDMRMESKKKGAILSERLITAINDRLAKKEQTILFLNRRGFSTSLICEKCGHVCECPNCSVALTFHRAAGRVVCHICGHQAVAPGKCPECKDPGIKYSGTGTEKVEDAVGKCFPTAVVKRMDADTMTRKDAFRETLGAFKVGKIDILVGTQMIAKGLHFPNVTLVGIINADLSLHLPDFRAGERTFQLLTQVAGRCGRGDVEGEVFVQSFTPFSPSIQFARHHDFDGFWEQEIEFRRQWDYPPFSHLVLIVIRSQHQQRAEFSAQTLHRRLTDALPPNTTLSEPAPAPLEKSHGNYRYHLMLRTHAIQRLSRHLAGVLEKLTFPEDVIVTVDVDAYQLL